VERKPDGAFKQEGQLLVHFHLDDGLHQMDAQVLHDCEGYVLCLLQEVGKQLDLDFRIEARAHPEGGVEVWLTAVGKHVAALTLMTSIVAGCFAAGKWIIYDKPLTEQQHEKNDLTLKKLRLEIKKMELEAAVGAEKAPATKANRSLDLEAPPTIEEVLFALEEKNRVKRFRSNFYKTLEREQRVTAVGFAPLHRAPVDTENIVQRAEFGLYILGKSELDPTRFENVEIEIVAPVLQRKALKWRGIFSKQSISFAITDQKFLDLVADKRVAFQNGTTLVCDLLVHWQENDSGDPEPYLYTVDRIHHQYIKTSKQRLSSKRANTEEAGTAIQMALQL
jgi:hypothetical protein